MEKALQSVVDTVKDAKGALTGLVEELGATEPTKELVEHTVNVINSVVDDLT